jgi:MOSC domain-containing protein YiiM
MQNGASVVQVSISKGGMPKVAVPYGVVTRLGIEGDVHAHPEVHGGPDKALLLVTSEGIAELQAEGYPVQFGALGENITTRGLDRRMVRVGQRYRVGEIVIEITKVRSPCKSLRKLYGSELPASVYDADVKAGDPSSPRWGLSGFYASVVQTGTIRPGDPVQFLDQAV